MTAATRPEFTVTNPRPFDAGSVARLSRRIALRFVRGASTGWSASELSHWLREHADLAVRIDRPATLRASRPHNAYASKEALAAELELARSMVREVLTALADPQRAPTTLADLTLAQLVTPFVDRSRQQGFLPSVWPGMSLADRLLSLVTVVYAVRPLGFELPLRIDEGHSSTWAAMPRVPWELLGVQTPLAMDETALAS